MDNVGFKNYAYIFPIHKLVTQGIRVEAMI